MKLHGVNAIIAHQRIEMRRTSTLQMKCDCGNESYEEITEICSKCGDEVDDCDCCPQCQQIESKCKCDD